MDETLIKQVAELTGLPEDSIQQQISKIALEQGKSPTELSLENIREIMIHMLQDLFTSIKEGGDPSIEIS